MKTAFRILSTVLAIGAGSAVVVTGVDGQQETTSVQNSPAATPEQIGRGQYLTALGDCIACHTREGGEPYAGGRPLPTPFGTILSANITPDQKTGLGGWTKDQFYRALHEGIDDEGNHLYPAFPYNYYTKVSREDSDAIFAYLRTRPAVQYRPNRNQLAFPFNIRGLMAIWNLLFLDAGEFKADPSKSAEWNRGAYLVNGLGHCGACHTPMNYAGAPDESQFLHGGTFADWFAPDLTRNDRTGLGRWSAAEVVEFLKSGRNPHTSAAAEMGDVVAYSTSRADAADLKAIVTYLRDQRASPAATLQTSDGELMREGKAIFIDSCSACHAMGGEGVPGIFPPLKGDANLQQRDPATTLHFVLSGIQSTPTGSRPTGFAMPAYAWKLDDRQIAAVETYIRNAWGNSAAQVSGDDVAKLRAKLVKAGAQFAKPEDPGSLLHPSPHTLAPSGTDSRDNGTPQAGRAAAPGPDDVAGSSGASNGGTGGTSPGGKSSGGPG